MRIPNEDMLEDDIFKTRIIMEPQNFPELTPPRSSFLDDDAGGQVSMALDAVHSRYISGLVQERRNSIANALELRLACTNLSI